MEPVQMSKEPKGFIDLHLHLDGAITPQIAKRLCEVQKISLGLTEGQLESRLAVGRTAKTSTIFCGALSCRFPSSNRDRYRNGRL